MTDLLRFSDVDDAIIREYESQNHSYRPFGTIGNDNRQVVTSTTEIPWRRICHLEILHANGSIGFGSGWMLGPRAVVTAGHCVCPIGTSALPQRITIRAGRSKDAEAPFGIVTSNKYTVEDDWRYRKDSRYDYAGIELPDDRLWTRTGSFEFAYFNDDFFISRKAHTGGYPKKGADSSEMYCGTDLIEVSSKHYLRHRIDTSEGQSGSPLYVYDKQSDRRVVIGIHTTYYGLNYAVRITREIENQFASWAQVGRYTV